MRYRGPVIAALAVDTSGNYSLAYNAFAIMVRIALVLAFLTRPVGSAEREAEPEAALAS